MKTKKPDPVKAERDRCAACVPTNWCDSLLSGRNGPIPEKGPYTAKHIERLLLAIKRRITD